MASHESRQKDYLFDLDIGVVDIKKKMLGSVLCNFFIMSLLFSFQFIYIVLFIYFIIIYFKVLCPHPPSASILYRVPFSNLVNCYFQVWLQLKVILYVAKITKNTVTEIYRKMIIVLVSLEAFFRVITQRSPHKRRLTAVSLAPGTTFLYTI